MQYKPAITPPPPLTLFIVLQQWYCDFTSHIYTPNTKYFLTSPVILTSLQEIEDLLKNLHNDWARYLLYHINITSLIIWIPTLNLAPWNILALQYHISTGTLALSPLGKSETRYPSLLDIFDSSRFRTDLPTFPFLKVKPLSYYHLFSFTSLISYILI